MAAAVRLRSDFDGTALRRLARLSCCGRQVLRLPELNPVENVWQFMRDNWLSNRMFGSYADILDHCCHAWNTLVDQPWRIMSLGLRRWTHGS